MYADYFGLKDTPFSIAPNPKYLFMSAKHREALGHLLYGVTVEGGFVMLTGEVGTGKTTICRSLLEQMPENTDVAFVLNPLQNAKEMLQSICDELHVAFDKDDANIRSLSNALYKFLLANHGRGRNTVLLIDEAQNLDAKVLELIRLLTNLETNTKKLLQIIFIGQPELRELLSKPELRQLAQRITARYHIEPLTQSETKDYIRHRLQVAGLPASQELFSPGLVKSIHQHAQGIPRVINILCDRLLLGAYAENKSQADKHTLKKALREVAGETPGRHIPQWLPWSVAGAFALLAASLWLWPAQESPVPVVEQVKPEVKVSAPVYFDRETSALNSLLNLMGLATFAGPLPCETLPLHGWRCGTEQVKNWQELMDINRPAVLTLSQQGQQRYVALIALDGNEAILQTAEKTERVPLMALGNMWNGQFTYLWQSPKDFDKPMNKGERSPLVRTIAAQFATLDQQTTPLATVEYNDRLAQRVKLFQSAHGLEADGIVGTKTLLKLNEAVGNAITLTGPQSLQHRLNNDVMSTDTQAVH